MVRKWTFMKINDLPDVQFSELQFGATKIKVSKIGSADGDFPAAKCWWLRENLHHGDDFEKFQSFYNSLTPTKLPELRQIKEASEILNRWERIAERNAGEGTFFYRISLIDFFAIKVLFQI